MLHNVIIIMCPSTYVDHAKAFLVAIATAAKDL